jgi:hypothetical protein
MTAVVAAAAGAVVSALLACIPGLHIYNVLGLMVLVAGGSGLPSGAVLRRHDRRLCNG